MNDYEQAFGEERIVRQLARFRVANARKRHRVHLLAAISPLVRDPSELYPPDVEHLFPSRRQWLRPPKEGRRGRTRDQVQINALLSAVRKGEPDAPWRRRLVDTVARIQSMARTGNISFTPPRCFQVPKDNGGSRTVAAFTNLEERTLISLLSHHLSRQIDSLLSDAVHAFRADVRRHCRDAAIGLLLRYRDNAPAHGLWVAECDIRQFYDSVPHEAIRASLARADRELRRRNGNGIAPAALQLVDAYLAAYRYGHADADTPRGIPQGGALSPILANLVLRAADSAALQSRSSVPPYYARFCDDILIVHPRRDVCLGALRRYIDALSDLGIPAHEPRNVDSYGSGFFDMKSKLPYRWTDPSNVPAAAPWVPFLGYHICHDGAVRVRRSSMNKHKKKIRKTLGDISRLVRQTPPDKLHKDPQGILDSARQQLIHMAVGHANLLALGDSPSQPCWADAFRRLNDNPSARGQLSGLDRIREHRLARFRNDLLAAVPPAKDPPDAEEKPDSTHPFHCGAPFSYRGILDRKNDSKRPFPFPWIDPDNAGIGY